MDDKIKNKLLRVPASEYGEHYRTHVMEIYKLYVSLADNISARRQNANSFYLTVNTGLAAFLGYTKMAPPDEQPLIYLALFAGIILCYTWYRLIKSYKGLNSAKFRIIHLIEQALPLSPYDAEWEACGRGCDSSKYTPFTHVELYVPWIFILLYSCIALILLLSKIKS